MKSVSPLSLRATEMYLFIVSTFQSDWSLSHTVWRVVGCSGPQELTISQRTMHLARADSPITFLFFSSSSNTPYTAHRKIRLTPICFRCTVNLFLQPRFRIFSPRNLSQCPGVSLRRRCHLKSPATNARCVNSHGSTSK